MITEDIGAMPKMAGGATKTGYEGFSVKYYKCDMNEPADVMELCTIETRALQSKPGKEEVVLVDKDHYTFMDKYFIILKYLEKTI